MFKIMQKDSRHFRLPKNRQPIHLQTPHLTSFFLNPNERFKLVNPHRIANQRLISIQLNIIRTIGCQNDEDVHQGNG